MRLTTPRLDFLVVGAQKAGTTSLWRYLEDNSRLRMPPDKEAPFFSEPDYPGDFRGYMRAIFKDAPRRARLGTVTPMYMMGTPGVSVPEVAQRIGVAAPQARLIALLRDPVERAASGHRMAVRDHAESRSFEEAVAALLEGPALDAARAGPTYTSTYVVAGEYGRMLAGYLEHFPPEQLHVELTDDLERDPAGVVQRVCRFLEVEPHRPARLGERFTQAGPRLLPAQAEADLLTYLDRNVWPRMRHSAQHRHAFENWFNLWNVAPGPVARTPDSATVERLRDHYRADAARLREATGLDVPWA